MEGVRRMYGEFWPRGSHTRNYRWYDSGAEWRWRADGRIRVVIESIESNEGRRVVKRGKDEMKVKRSERRVDVLFGDVSRQ